MARLLPCLLILCSTPTAVSTKNLFTGVYGDDRSSMSSQMAGPWGTHNGLTPLSSNWWPGITFAQPDPSTGNACVDGDGNIYTVSADGGVVQMAHAGTEGAVQAWARINVSDHTPFSWLINPLPLRMSMNVTHGQNSNMVFYAFYGCIRNSSPLNCSTVLMGIITYPSQGPLWVTHVADTAPNTQLLSLSQMNDEYTALILMSSNANGVYATTFVASSGQVYITAKLPPVINATSCPVAPGVGYATAVGPSPAHPTLFRGHLIASVGSGYGASSFQPPCVFAVDLASGSIIWAVALESRSAPIVASDVDSQGRLPVYLIANGIVMAADAYTGAPMFTQSYSRRETLAFGAALGPAGAAAGAPTWLIVAATWGRPYAVTNLYAFDVANNAYGPSMSLPMYPDTGVGGGQVLVSPPSVNATTAGLMLQVYVRGTSSFAASAYDTAPSDSSDSVYASKLYVIGLLCPSSTSGKGCSFMINSLNNGLDSGTPTGGSLAVGPYPGQLMLASSQGIQILVADE